MPNYPVSPPPSFLYTLTKSTLASAMFASSSSRESECSSRDVVILCALAAYWWCMRTVLEVSGLFFLFWLIWLHYSSIAFHSIIMWNSHKLGYVSGKEPIDCTFCLESSTVLPLVEEFICPHSTWITLMCIVNISSIVYSYYEIITINYFLNENFPWRGTI